jgi:hypothetical protein
MKNDINNLNVFSGKIEKKTSFALSRNISGLCFALLALADEVLYIMIQYLDRLQFARGDKMKMFA